MDAMCTFLFYLTQVFSRFFFGLDLIAILIGQHRTGHIIWGVPYSGGGYQHNGMLTIVWHIAIPISDRARYVPMLDASSK